MKKLTLFILLAFVMPLFGAEPDTIYYRLDDILRQYVSPDGLVDYSGLVERDTEIKGLVTGLAEFDHALLQTDAEREAFWINTYNLLVLESVLDNYPIKASRIKSFMYPENSIRHISNVFARPNFPFEGDTLSLDDIEHSILRSELKDPLIHFALVCGAVDCPPLRHSAYRSDSLEEQLRDQAQRFLSKQRNFSFDGKSVVLSEIFSWFGSDFAVLAPEKGIPGLSSSEAGFMSLIADIKHSEEILKGGYRISYTEYNWGLNDWKRDK